MYREGQMAVDSADAAHIRDEHRSALPYLCGSLCVLPPEAAYTFRASVRPQGGQADGDALRASDHRENLQEQRPDDHFQKPGAQMDEGEDAVAALRSDRYETQGHIRRTHQVLRNRRGKTRLHSGSIPKESTFPLRHRLRDDRMCSANLYRKHKTDKGRFYRRGSLGGLRASEQRKS